MTNCQFCEIPIDKACKDMQKDALIEGWCPVCDEMLDYGEDEVGGGWGDGEYS